MTLNPNEPEGEAIRVFLQAGATTVSIMVGLIGVLYAVFAQFARPDNEGRRLPVVGKLKSLARWLLIPLCLSALTVMLAIFWLLHPESAIYYVALVTLVLNLVMVILISLWIVFRLFI